MVAGRFGDLVEAAESHPQYPSLLGSDFSCSDTDSYARQVHLALRLFLRHVRPEPLFRRKDCASAEAARLEGNALFQRREVNKARAAYSKSVICAPKVETVRRDIGCHMNEKEKHIKKSGFQELLSLSLANRSACSLHLGNFSHAIADIHHALALNYPKEKRSKVKNILSEKKIVLVDHEASFAQVFSFPVRVYAYKDSFSLTSAKKNCCALPSCFDVVFSHVSSTCDILMFFSKQVQKSNQVLQPPFHSPQLYLRLAKCHLKLGQPERGRPALQVEKRNSFPHFQAN